MKKITSLIFGLFCLVSLWNANAQSVGSSLNGLLNEAKSTKAYSNLFPQSYITENINGEDYVYLLMRVDKANDLKFLQKYDCTLRQRVGRIVSVRINVKDLQKFVQEKDIIEVDLSRKVGAIDLNYATKDLNAKDIWQGTGLEKAYTGKDVLVGVADWGIDYTHPTFYDSTGTEYRITAAWDQTRKQGPTPEGYDYGSYFGTEADLLAAQCDTSNQYDTGYHATHVGGIAAGSGAGTNYIGVAPEANLLFCTWICDEAHYMDCCTWMRDVAKKQGKRLVINNSWGVYNMGTMDGTSMMDEFINTMIEQDSIIFVISAGNNGDAPFHLKAEFNAEKKDTVRSEIQYNFPEPYNRYYWGQAITMQSENGAKFYSKIEFYDYAWNKFAETPLLESNGETIDETVLVLDGGDSIIYTASSRLPQDSRHIVDWKIRQSRYTDNSNHVVLAVYCDNGVVHAWNLNCLSKAVGNTGFSFLASQDGYTSGDTEYGVSEPALTEKAITVAAHQFRNTAWHPTIASFSSRGPNIVSYYKPEISAPGYAIISSVSSFSNTAPKAAKTVTFNGKDYAFGSASGTSMSGPMVAGSVALILQANPNLTSEEVKQIILQTAKTDTYTGECPNDTWGYGKINTYEAVKMAEKKVGLKTIEEMNINVFPIPAKNVLFIEGLQEGDEIDLFDNLGRKQKVKRLNFESLDVKDLKSGVYILTIHQNGKKESVKFLKK